jgi:hypothetical protein
MNFLNLFSELAAPETDCNDNFFLFDDLKIMDFKRLQSLIIVWGEKKLILWLRDFEELRI